MPLEKFEDYEVWQIAKRLIIEIYKLTAKFPKEEVYNLTSQTRSAALSIPSNIAEGFGRFHYLTRNNFFYNSRGSLEELKSHLLISKDLGYIAQSDHDLLRDQLDTLGVKLNNLIEKTYKLHRSNH
jgi:four helix bundle protein